jgi:hypothetical protein
VGHDPNLRSEAAHEKQFPIIPSGDVINPIEHEAMQGWNDDLQRREMGVYISYTCAPAPLSWRAKLS